MESTETALEIANLAATYLIEGAADTFQSAKEKAARAIDSGTSKNLPSNILVQRALAYNLSLLEGEDWRVRINEMRRASIEAMRFLADFDPHLVGSVLYGTATEFSVICIHVYSDDVESVIWRLADANIKYHLGEVTLNGVRKNSLVFPNLEIAMANFDFDIVIFPLKYRFHPPNSPLDGKPYQRADMGRVQRLVEDQQILFGKYLDVATEQSG